MITVLYELKQLRHWSARPDIERPLWLREYSASGKGRPGHVGPYGPEAESEKFFGCHSGSIPQAGSFPQGGNLSSLSTRRVWIASSSTHLPVMSSLAFHPVEKICTAKYSQRPAVEGSGADASVFGEGVVASSLGLVPGAHRTVDREHVRYKVSGHQETRN